jgi:hypothetical protein
MRRLHLFLFVVLCVALAGCGRTVTPAELDRYETRTYAGHSRAEAFHATVTALKSLGYEIALADEDSGRVKTAPKIVAVHAAAVSSYHAVATGDAVAWTVDVASADGGATVHAVPRPYSAGQALEPTRLNADFADRTFRTLYAEIESNLSSQTTTSSAPAPSTKPKAISKRSHQTKKSGAKPVGTKAPAEPEVFIP